MIITMDKLKYMLRDQGLTQEWLASKIKVNKIHLNKVLNATASLTKPMAEKIANLPEIDLTVQDLMFPSNPLKIVGQYFSQSTVDKFEMDQPEINLPGHVSPGWVGVLFRGNPDNDSAWQFKTKESFVEMFDSSFYRDKIIDPRAVGSRCIVGCKQNQWSVGWLAEMDKKTGKHRFMYDSSAVSHYFVVEWASIIHASLNLKSLETEVGLKLG